MNRWFRQVIFKKIRRQPQQNPSPAESARPDPEHPLSSDLQENMDNLKLIFQDCSDIVFREIKLGGSLQGFVVFIDGIVKSEEIDQQLLRPLFFGFPNLIETVTLDEVEAHVALSQLKRTRDLHGVVEAILTANVVLIIDGCAEGAVFNVRGGARRGVQEPETETVIRGPREGFTENIRTNTALVRFRLKTPDLKMTSFTLGKKTKTNVLLCYLDGVAEPKLIEEAKHRLNSIEIDAVLESGYIEELIQDHRYSPFPQLQISERPDTVVSQLLEGRFAIMVDGTPFVLTAPVTLWSFLQASEDYYERYFLANFFRWLRVFFMMTALLLPSLYIAVTTFHRDMLPTTLILSIASAREAIPFPAVVEALIMEISFEALREAGIRLPKIVGATVSILGALVIGQAAVQAGIVSAPMVIIVSMTGIASFSIPRFSFAIAIRLLRFPLMFLAGIFGLFGIVFGLIMITVHLCNLQSFGVPYLTGVAPYEPKEQKDIFVRVPWWRMDFRPTSIARHNQKRIDQGIKPSPNES